MLQREGRINRLPRFEDLLTEGILAIQQAESTATKKKIYEIEAELAEAIGRKPSTIQWFRKGHLPTTWREAEGLAREIYRRGRVNAEWLNAFLASTNVPRESGLADRIIRESEPGAAPEPAGKDVQAGRLSGVIRWSAPHAHQTRRRVTTAGIFLVGILTFFLASPMLNPPLHGGEENEPEGEASQVGLSSIPITEEVPEITSTPTFQATRSIGGQALFSEDFKNGLFHELIYRNGGWRMVREEDGNYLIEVDNSTSTDYPNLTFGSLFWDDYRLTFRLRFQKAVSGTIVEFRSDEIGSNKYPVLINQDHVTLHYTQNSFIWEPLVDKARETTPGQWHWVTIEARGDNITISVDGQTAIDTHDSRHSAGRIAIVADIHSFVQIDDIAVVALEGSQ